MTRSDLYLNFIQRLSIRNEQAQLQKLTLWEPQKMIWERIADRLNQRKKIWLIALKARQEGVSTLIESLLVARTALDDMIHAQVIAHEKEATKRIWQMANTMVESHAGLKAVANKKHDKIFLGKSYLGISTAGSAHASRSGNFTCVHMSEVAFWPDPDAMLAVKQCVPDKMDTFCMIESTANGKVGDGQLFYQEWLRAERGESDFIPIFLPWFAIPKYCHEGYVYQDEWEWLTAEHRQTVAVLENLDEEELQLREQFKVTAGQLAWRRWVKINKCEDDVDKLHQEYPSTPEEAFVNSGLPFFRAKDLTPLEPEIRKGARCSVTADGTIRADVQGPLEIWVRPVPGRKYVIGADPSMGLDAKARSRSSAEILDMVTLEQVGEYEAAAAPHIFADHLVGMARYFNNALIAPEVQSSGGGGGREILKFIQDHKYWNLHRWSGSGPDKMKQTKSHLYGWETNARTRPRMLSWIRKVVLQRCATIHSRKLFQQFSDFGENDAGRDMALTGHDDLLFAYGIALVSRSENYIEPTTGVADPEPVDYARYGMKVQGDLQNVLREHRLTVLKGGKREIRSYLEL